MAARFRDRFGGDPRIDPSTIGITFVDVLFALVVGFAVEPIGTWWQIPAAGWSHLAVAAVITLTSWVGYHYSTNRPRFAIGFPNLPLVQFVLDIGMVIVYALTVLTAEGVLDDPIANRAPTAVPEAWLVVAAFVLYVLWDVVGRAVLAGPEYREAWAAMQRARPDLALPDMDRPGDDEPRRWVTRWCLVAAVAVLAVTLAIDPSGTAAVVAVDVALVVLLLAFRILKEFVSPPRTMRAAHR